MGGNSVSCCPKVRPEIERDTESNFWTETFWREKEHEYRKKPKMLRVIHWLRDCPPPEQCDPVDLGDIFSLKFFTTFTPSFHILMVVSTSSILNSPDFCKSIKFNQR